MGRGAAAGLLASRDRDTITGDLLEEYRESVVPVRGERCAQLWYVRQALSLVTLERIRYLATGTAGRFTMADRSSVPSFAWLAAGAAATATILLGLVRSQFGPFDPWALYVGTAILAIAVAGSSLASRRHALRMFTAAWPWGVMLGIVLVARFTVDVLFPVDQAESMLRRVVESYSILGEPRRWLVGVGVVTVLAGAGFQGASRSGSVRVGTLAAVAAAMLGTGLALLVGVAGLPIRVPVLSLLVQMLCTGAILGTIGAFFGRGFASTASHVAPTVPTPPALP